MNITLISPGETPEFLVKLDRPQSTPLLTKIKTVAVNSFLSITLLFSCLASSIYDEARFSGVSFKHLVLECYGPLKNYSLSLNTPFIILKLGVWILGMTANIVLTTGRRYIEKMEKKSPFLIFQGYIDEGIDETHIRTNHVALDASSVPANINLESLMTLFNTFNFDDPQSVDYIQPSKMQQTEGNSVKKYSKEELRLHLETLIKRVNDRIPFIGTPKSAETQRLEEFYRHVENAIRLSLDATQKKREAFEKNNGTDHSLYEESAKREYLNCFEDQVNIVITLAIAGVHCGARYMDDANALYDLFKESSSSNNNSLKETLVNLLAEKRASIAQAEIDKHFTKTKKQFNPITQEEYIVFEGVNVHASVNYRATLGTLLGIPNSKYITEQLSTPLPKDKYLKSFFEQYSIETITTTIQEKYKDKNSQEFRETITDWLKAQMGSWSERDPKDQIKLKSQLFETIKAICKTQDSNEIKTNNIKKIFQDNLIPSPTEESLKRLLEDQTLLEDLIDLSFRQNDEGEFLTRLGLEDPDAGLSPELIEWLLVSQNILLPKSPQKQSFDNSKPLKTESLTTLISKEIDEEASSWLKSFNGVFSKEQMEKTAQELLKKYPRTRYSYNTSSTNLLLTQLFQKAFSKNSNEIITEAEKITSQTFYSKIRKWTFIEAPKVIHNVLDNPLVTIMGIFLLFLKSYRISLLSYKHSQHLLAARIIPFIINNTAIGIIRFSNNLISSIQKLRSNRLVSIALLAGVYLTNLRIKKISNIARQIFFAAPAGPFILGLYLTRRTFDVLISLYSVKAHLANCFISLKTKNEAERLSICKSKALEVWIAGMNKQLQETSCLYA